jgi:fumarylacetoacetase
MERKHSWVDSANTPTTDFPLNNLPCGVFSQEAQAPRCGVAIGDQVFDVTGAEASGWLDLPGGPLFTHASWNALMAAGPGVWALLRARLTDLLGRGAADRAELSQLLVPQDRVRLHLPFTVAEFTDFYAGRHHAQNVGTLFRGPENALPPNWLHMPIGYNGRASSVVVSGTDVHRPLGQLKGPEDAAPHLGPSQRFDFELELGTIVGTPSDRPLSVREAFASIFGYVLLNDWSARDIQAWEYQPLGPFQSKASATTLSPWIVTAAALEPFLRNAPDRDVPLLPHLQDAGPMFPDIDLTVSLTPQHGSETRLTRTNARELYYSAAQQLAHHSTCGCPMRTGDLLGSGTISGP